MSRHPATLALIPVILLLSACSAPAAVPGVTPDPTPLEVAAVDGNWIITRTVTADTTGEFTVGDAATRYLVLGASECDPAQCTGSVLSAGTDDVFVQLEDTDPHATGTYAWDGETFALTLDSQLLNCTGSGGELVAAKQYTSDVEYALVVVDGAVDPVTLATGTAVQEIAETGDYPGPECPSGGRVDYDVELTRA